MGPVPDINPSGSGMHYIQSWVRRLQLARQISPLFSIPCVSRHLRSFHGK
jgi:hypothetical protein